MLLVEGDSGSTGGVASVKTSINLFGRSASDASLPRVEEQPVAGVTGTISSEPVVSPLLTVSPALNNYQISPGDLVGRLT